MKKIQHGKAFLTSKKKRRKNKPFTLHHNALRTLSFKQNKTNLNVLNFRSTFWFDQFFLPTEFWLLEFSTRCHIMHNQNIYFGFKNKYFITLSKAYLHCFREQILNYINPVLLAAVSKCCYRHVVH